MLIQYLDDGSFDFGIGFFNGDGFYDVAGTTTTSWDIFNSSTGVSAVLFGSGFPNFNSPVEEDYDNATITSLLFSSENQDQMRISGVSWNLFDFFTGIVETELGLGFPTFFTLFDQSDIFTVDGTGASSGIDMRESFRVFDLALTTPFDVTGSSFDDFLLFGARGDDNVSGGDGDDWLRGREGNDTLHGDAGDDDLWGDDGQDLIFGGDGNDTIRGDDGNDNASGGAGNDRIFGDEGYDSLVGNDGEDYLDGGDDDDQVFGADGNDTILGGEGRDMLGGANGDDLLFGGNGRDTLFGGNDDDTLNGGDGDDVVSGGHGADLILASQGRDQVDGGTGNDTIDYTGSGSAVTVRLNKETAVTATYVDSVQGVENVIGTGFNDRIVGDIGQNELWSGSGNDTINNLGGNDTIDAGTGDDSVIGSSDAEQITLGDGDDVARTKGGDDLIEGGLGNDTIAGNGGADIAFGDDGDDTFFMGSQNDTVFGGAGEDVINGGFSADVLDGGADDDRVRGDAGVDQINGGDGDDLLVGGANADTFWFFDTDATGVDRIKDFEDGLDRINLSDWGFASDADVFAIASMAGGANQHTRLDFTDGSSGEVRALVIENLDISDFDASDFLLTGSDPFVF